MKPSPVCMGVGAQQPEAEMETQDRGLTDVEPPSRRCCACCSARPCCATKRRCALTALATTLLLAMLLMVIAWGLDDDDEPVAVRVTLGSESLRKMVALAAPRGCRPGEACAVPLAAGESLNDLGATAEFQDVVDVQDQLEDENQGTVGLLLNCAGSGGFCVEGFFEDAATVSAVHEGPTGGLTARGALTGDIVAALQRLGAGPAGGVSLLFEVSCGASGCGVSLFREGEEPLLGGGNHSTGAGPKRRLWAGERWLRRTLRGRKLGWARSF